MRDATCAVDGCPNRNEMTQECSVAKRWHQMCAYGLMATILHNEVGDLGAWRMLRYKEGPMRATLRGRAGAVEVWGGLSHAREVWFIDRSTKAETLLCDSWAVTDGSLRDAVERGCAMAQIQTKMTI